MVCIYAEATPNLTPLSVVSLKPRASKFKKKDAVEPLLPSPLPVNEER